MAAEDDSQRQEDELCALRAILGEDAVVVGEGGAALSFAVPDADAQPHLQLRVHLPDLYPSQLAPLFELTDSCGVVPGGVLGGLAAELEAMFAPGEVVLWNWVEHLRERWAELAPQHGGARSADAGADAGVDTTADADADAALAAELQAAELEAGGGGGDTQQPQRVQRDPELEAALAEVADSVVHGEPFTEKRSTFQAHLAPATSLRHVEALVELLLRNNKVRAATHNIMAYRIEHPARGTWLQDYDDDGEAAAGGRLLHLLQMADVRNVCVIVSRWYGGVLLGPARFTHINNAARALLDEHGYIAPKDAGKGGAKGRAKR